MFDRLRRSGYLQVVAGIGVGAVLGILALAAVNMPVSQRLEAGVAAMRSAPLRSLHKNIARFADLRGEDASNDVRYIADWVADSRDADGKPFVVIDKKGARVYVFDRDARLLGASPVLLGFAPGDDTVPGIGDKPLAEVLPSERTTPAGRFLGERGHNARGEDVVWVDYEAAVSMHRVLTSNPAEHRLERLASPSIEDNRVSFGCINVPVAFYERFLRPTFASVAAMIYVLPDTRPLKQVFAQSYDVAAAHGLFRNQAHRVPDGDALMLLLFALRSG